MQALIAFTATLILCSTALPDDVKEEFQERLREVDASIELLDQCLHILQNGISQCVSTDSDEPTRTVEQTTVTQPTEHTTSSTSEHTNTEPPTEGPKKVTEPTERTSNTTSHGDTNTETPTEKARTEHPTEIHEEMAEEAERGQLQGEKERSGGQIEEEEEAEPPIYLIHIDRSDPSGQIVEVHPYVHKVSSDSDALKQGDEQPTNLLGYPNEKPKPSSRDDPYFVIVDEDGDDGEPTLYIARTVSSGKKHWGSHHGRGPLSGRGPHQKKLGGIDEQLLRLLLIKSKQESNEEPQSPISNKWLVWFRNRPTEDTGEPSVTEHPEVTEEPSQPAATEHPETMATEHPEVTEGPSRPAATEHTETVATEHPEVTEEPSHPLPSHSTAPTYERPTSPTYERPSSPTYERPSSPTYERPTSPTYERPTQKVTTEPPKLTRPTYSRYHTSPPTDTTQGTSTPNLNDTNTTSPTTASATSPTTANTTSPSTGSPATIDNTNSTTDTTTSPTTDSTTSPTTGSSATIDNTNPTTDTTTNPTAETTNSPTTGSPATIDNTNPTTDTTTNPTAETTTSPTTGSPATIDNTNPTTSGPITNTTTNSTTDTTTSPTTGSPATIDDTNSSTASDRPTSEPPTTVMPTTEEEHHETDYPDATNSTGTSPTTNASTRSTDGTTIAPTTDLTQNSSTDANMTTDRPATQVVPTDRTDDGGSGDDLFSNENDTDIATDVIEHPSETDSRNDSTVEPRDDVAESYLVVNIDRSTGTDVVSAYMMDDADSQSLHKMEKHKQGKNPLIIDRDKKVTVIVVINEGDSPTSSPEETSVDDDDMPLYPDDNEFDYRKDYKSDGSEAVPVHVHEATKTAGGTYGYGKAVDDAINYALQNSKRRKRETSQASSRDQHSAKSVDGNYDDASADIPTKASQLPEHSAQECLELFSHYFRQYYLRKMGFVRVDTEHQTEH